MAMQKRFVLFLSLFVFMPVVAVGVLALTNSFRVHDLQVFGSVPSFSLTERSGKGLRSEDLKGKVWIASFIFTHCDGQCPLLCEKLKRVQSKFRFKENFRLLSITMDPTRDTPDVLKEYATRFEADPYKWLFLTGEKKSVDSLVQNGFRLASNGPGGAEPEGITHSFKLVLVDGFGRIRGYYDGLEDASVKDLLSDTKSLLRKTF